MANRKCPVCLGRNLQKCQFIKHLLCSEGSPGALCLTSETAGEPKVGPGLASLLRVGCVCVWEGVQERFPHRNQHLCLLLMEIWGFEAGIV